MIPEHALEAVRSGCCDLIDRMAENGVFEGENEKVSDSDTSEVGEDTSSREENPAEEEREVSEEETPDTARFSGTTPTLRVGGKLLALIQKFRWLRIRYFL